MTYIFGYRDDAEVLKTVGDAHSALSGWVEHTEDYPDCRVYDRFRVCRKTGQAEDCSGICYDWYEIDRHYRQIDKKQAEQDICGLQDAVIELGAVIAEKDEHNAMLEDAILELATILGGDEV